MNIGKALKNPFFKMISVAFFYIKDFKLFNVVPIFPIINKLFDRKLN